MAKAGSWYPVLSRSGRLTLAARWCQAPTSTVWCLLMFRLLTGAPARTDAHSRPAPLPNRPPYRRKWQSSTARHSSDPDKRPSRETRPPCSVGIAADGRHDHLRASRSAVRPPALVAACLAVLAAVVLAVVNRPAGPAVPTGPCAGADRNSGPAPSRSHVRAPAAKASGELCTATTHTRCPPGARSTTQKVVDAARHRRDTQGSAQKSTARLAWSLAYLQRSVQSDFDACGQISRPAPTIEAPFAGLAEHQPSRAPQVPGTVVFLAAMHQVPGTWCGPKDFQGRWIWCPGSGGDTRKRHRT